jgi:hypothetical protein
MDSGSGSRHVLRATIDEAPRTSTSRFHGDELNSDFKSREDINPKNMLTR